MGPELRFLVEFLVTGTPVSSSNTGPSKEDWIETIRAAYGTVLPEDHWAASDSVYVTIFYFPDAPMRGDVDNIVKWLVDAMKPTVYIDDRQVERVIVQKFEPGRVFKVVQPSPVLARALETSRPVVYVRGDDESSVQETWS